VRRDRGVVWFAAGMSNVRESRVPRKFRSMKSALVVLAAAAVMVSACGSGSKASSSESTDPSDAASTTAAVAGAQENAVTSTAVCYSWPNGTTDAQPCAVGLKGPGGGRVFYDAGSVQSWGRFLEVAPQNWNGTLVDCRSCGVGPGVAAKTSDNGTGDGYYPCRNNETAKLLPGEAANTLWEIGGGRHNTDVLSKTVECVDGSEGALTLSTGYRGGGLSDWFLPSGGELTELCRYTERNAIGGFVSGQYTSSTVGPDQFHTTFFIVNFGNAPTCTRTDDSDVDNNGNYSSYYYKRKAVRPIRAFS